MTTALHSLPQMVLGYVPTDLQRLATQTIPPLPERPVVRVDLRMPDQPYRAFAFLFAQQANHSEVEHRLQSSLPGQPSDGTTWWGPELTSPPPPPSLAWVMPGSGALGGDFYGALGTIDSVVDAVRQEAEGYFANYTGQQVSFLALGEDGDERSLNPLYQRPATVTASVAMARLLQNFGIQPDFLAGHSVGELTACHLAGCFDLAQLIRLTTAPFIGGTLAPGAMAALMGNENTILELVQQSAGQVMVSNRNSPQQLVISGAAQAVHDLVAQAKAKRVKAIPLKVATAYHSPFLAEPHALYREALAHSTFQPAKRPVVCVALVKPGFCSNPCAARLWFYWPSQSCGTNSTPPRLGRKSLPRYWAHQ
jgi:Acyl transferase domain